MTVKQAGRAVHFLYVNDRRRDGEETRIEYFTLVIRITK